MKTIILLFLIILSIGCRSTNNTTFPPLWKMLMFPVLHPIQTMGGISDYHDSRTNRFPPMPPNSMTSPKNK